MHLSKFFSQINPFPSTNPQNQSTNIKQRYVHNKRSFFWRMHPFSIGLIFQKKHIRLGHPGIRSKYAGSNSHPTETGLEALARSRPDDSCTPACFRLDSFGQNLTWHNKLGPGWFCMLWSRLLVEERNRAWKWETGCGPVAFCRNPTWRILHTSLFPGRTCWTKTWSGHKD